MVKQYGNWMYTNESPFGNEDHFKSVLNEDMKMAGEEKNIDFSKGKVEYIFKVVPDEIKLMKKFDITEKLWTAGWKVTI